VIPTIHPTAIIEKGAELAEDVEIGAYAYIGAQVRLGKGCVVMHHASVEGNTKMGERNIVYPYCYIGAKTQDLKFKGGNPGTIIGDDNCFREYTSVHAATEDGHFTIIGSHNNFLAYNHIAHDCVIGDYAIISNNCGLAGHIHVGNHVVMGGMAGLHQFIRIGDYSMIGGMARVVQDVPPFVIAEGSPAKTRTVNKVGLERNNFTVEQMAEIRSAYKVLFKSGKTREQAVEDLREMSVGDNHLLVKQILEFVEKSDRGVC
jgi:UDP-N-acetylglucosamine acyltransferase